MPALSRAGSRWDVSRGNRVVFRMENAPGRVEWPTGETPHPFVSGRVLDRKEESRLRPIVLHARHFRDLVHRLEQAGYGVGAAADGGPAGG